MSSTAIIRTLLASTPAVTAIVPATRIIAGIVQQGTTLPAIGVSEVSSTAEMTVSRRTNTELVRSRVQVTVYGTSYPQMKQLLLACKMGKGVKNGTVAGFYVNSVMPAGTGPEIPPGDDKIFEQSRDFMVTFAEAN